MKTKMSDKEFEREQMDAEAYAEMQAWKDIKFQNAGHTLGPKVRRIVQAALIVYARTGAFRALEKLRKEGKI